MRRACDSRKPIKTQATSVYGVETVEERTNRREENVIGRLIFVAMLTGAPAAWAQKATPDSTLVVNLHVDKAHAIDRVQAVMTDAGLQILQSESSGLVVGAGTGPKSTTIHYSATVLAGGDSSSRVVLSAEALGNTINAGAISIKQRARVTSKTKHGGEKVWAQLLRLADSLKSGPGPN